MPVAPTIVQASRRVGTARPMLSGYMEHTTGRTIIAKARRKGHDPEAFVAARYAAQNTHPDAMIGWTGAIYLFGASPLVQSAHARWYRWERSLYRSSRWARGKRGLWARDYIDDTCSVQPAFYRDWFDRWQGGGRSYANPIEIAEKVGGRGASPNGTYFGVERLATDDGKSTPEQDYSSAWLFVRLAVENEWFDPAQIDPGCLPQPWYLGHSDINPARRWARVKRSMAEGFAWDPGDMVDWAKMGPLVVAVARETAPGSGGR